MKTEIQEMQSTQLPLVEVIRRHNENFREITKVEQWIVLISTNNADATAGAVSFYLPPGEKTKVSYLVRKIDASVNAVTVYPDGTDTIEGAASYALPNQYDKVLLQFESGVWYRISQ